MNIVTCTACGSSQIRKARPCIKCGAELPVLAIKGKPIAEKSSDVDHSVDANKKAWKKKQTAIQSTVIPDNDLGLVSFKDRMKKK